ncbi:MAG: hypothetical protein AAFQ82_10665, partial [Myxococcota bacterium]
MVNGLGDVLHLAQKVSAEQQAGQVDELKEKIESRASLAQPLVPAPLAAMDSSAELPVAPGALPSELVGESSETAQSSSFIMTMVQHPAPTGGLAPLDEMAQPPNVRDRLAQWLVEFDLIQSAGLI